MDLHPHDLAQIFAEQEWKWRGEKSPTSEEISATLRELRNDCKPEDGYSASTGRLAVHYAEGVYTYYLTIGHEFV